jgi:hypothetical protein
MMLRTIGSLAVIVALVWPTHLDAQAIHLDGGTRLRLTGRLQVQYNTSSMARGDGSTAGAIPFSTFETRRARLGVQLELADWIGSEIEAEFATGDVTLKYAFVDLAFDPRIGIRIGQFKKPFSLLELTSSTKILPIERGLRIRGLAESLLATSGPEPASSSFPILDGKPLLPEEQELLGALGYSGYDLGAELYGEFGRIGYQAGIFNGTGGSRRSETGGRAFAARLTYTPIADSPLTLGAAVSHREVNGQTTAGSPIMHGGTAFEIDAEWGAFRREGLHIMAEAALGNNLVEDRAFTGAQVIAANFRPIANSRVEGFEPLLRLSYGNSSHGRKGDEGWLLTPGLNIYFTGRNRLMLNWEIFAPSGERFSVSNALRAQAQIHF